MWALDFLPNIVFHIGLSIGIIGIIIGFFIEYIPLISSYEKPIKIFSIILIIVGVWYEGGIAKDEEYQQIISSLNQKIFDAEQHANEINSKIEYVYIDRIEPIKEIQYITKEKIRNIAPIINNSCKILPQVVEIHNLSAKGVKQ